jgi:hypothetical protein
MNSILKYLKSESGETYVDLLIIVLVVVVLIAFLIQIPGPFIAYQNLSYMCRNVARAIETTGEVNSDILSLIIDLQETTSLTPAITYEGLSWSGGTRKVQLRDRFAITMSIEYTINILSLKGEAAIKATIPITKKVNGIGEVYWKP